MLQTKIMIDSFSLNVKVALKRHEQEEGLKKLDTLSGSNGLLIILPEPVKTGVWMKDTLLPLSVAYIDKDYIITEIKQLKPLDETFEISLAPIQFILETNQNWFEKRNITVGNKVVVENIKHLIQLAQPRQIGFRSPSK